MKKLNGPIVCPICNESSNQIFNKPKPFQLATSALKCPACEGRFDFYIRKDGKGYEQATRITYISKDFKPRNGAGEKGEE